MACLYIDCFSGISGDMVLGALLELGLRFEDLDRAIQSLGIQGIELGYSKVRRGGMACSRFDVKVLENQPLRRYAEILGLIGSSGLSKRVRERVSKVFGLLARAEAQVHGVPEEEVHFHEIGAVDSIVDIVGVCYGLDALGIDEVFSSPVPLSPGMIHSLHGPIPLPAPATLVLLEGAPVYGLDSGHELVTPTGAAILKAFALGFGAIPPMLIKGIGMGAGQRDPSGWPNLLRLIMGERQGFSEQDWVVQIWANVDDRDPTELGFTAECLMEEGALDVCMLPCYMKKNRPGVQLQVLARIEDLERLGNSILNSGISLGFRYSLMPRKLLKRWVEKIDSPWGPVRVKFAKTPGGRILPWPEYEDLRAISLRDKIPIRELRAWLLGHLGAEAPFEGGKDP